MTLGGKHSVQVLVTCISPFQAQAGDSSSTYEETKESDEDKESNEEKMDSDADGTKCV